MDFLKLNFIIQKFFNNTKVLNIDAIHSGLINKTYLVEHFYNGEKSKFILQCLSNIFESYDIVNTNHKLITDHINWKLNNIKYSSDSERWEVPDLIKCKSNNLFSLRFESDFWRAMLYIDGTFSLDLLEDKLMAYNTGIGLSKFHAFCSDLDSTNLESSIKNFHNTKYYLERYIIAIKEYKLRKSGYQSGKRIQELIYSLSDMLNTPNSCCHL